MASRVIFQLAEDVVTELLVERKCLKVESVAMRVETASSARLVLCGAHETPADAASSYGLCDPKLLNEEPAPVRMAHQSANELAVMTRENDQLAMYRRWGLGLVVADQRPHDLLAFLWGAMFADGDFDFAHW